MGRTNTASAEASPPRPSLDAALERAASVLSPAPPSLPASFAFRWRGIPFRGEVAEHGAAVRLRLAADLGLLPFSAENRAARGRLLALLLPAPGVGVHGYGLDERQRLVHCAEALLAAPVTRAGIFAAIVQCLLRARPFLQLARSCADDPPAVAAAAPVNSSAAGRRSARGRSGPGRGCRPGLPRR